MYQLYLWFTTDWEYLYDSDFEGGDGYYIKADSEDCGYGCVKGFQFSYLPFVIIAILLYQRRFVSTWFNF